MVPTTTLYRSSAGSGKTHTIVLAYLKLALKSSAKFQKILAITFTNKATAEMKDRILHVLHQLSLGNPTSMTKELLLHHHWDEKELQKRAQDTLSNILHQYSRFAVSTIDSFFQKTVRSFSKEIGLQQGFVIELDQQHVLEQLVQSILEQAAHKPMLQRWLLSFAEQKLLAGKNWSFHRELLYLGSEIFSETFRFYEGKILHAMEKPDLLQTFPKKLQEIISKFELNLQQIGKEALSVIDKAGFKLEDFAYGKQGVMGYFYHLSQRKKWEPSVRSQHALADSKAWFSKSAPNKERLEQLVLDELLPLLQKAIEFYEQHCPVYLAAKSVYKLIYALGITTHLLEQLNTYRDEKGVMLISDAAIFLKQIMEENKIPFVYEKTGAFYQHFFIDEFQDISHFQWNNLVPLIENSAADGHQSLIVGDAKQSIYRWRGGDPSLLLSEVEKDLGGGNVQSINLEHNWRSQPTIIGFNNSFFEAAVPLLSQYLAFQGEEAEIAEEDMLALAYEKVAQKVPAAKEASKDEGYVEVRFFHDNEEAAMLQKRMEAHVVKEVHRLMKDGFTPSDIAILVRNNAEAQSIVHALLNAQKELGLHYPVAASAAMYLHQNPYVNLFINALHFIDGCEDKLLVVELAMLYQQYVCGNALSDLTQALATSDFDEVSIDPFLPPELIQIRKGLNRRPLYDQMEALIAIFQLSDSSSFPFIQSLQELILEFTQREGEGTSDFLHWWETLGKQQSMSGSEAGDALQVMTLHQSKGLQFKIVLIPFCHWLLDHNPHKAPVLWCESQQAPFSDFPLLPVAYHKVLEKTPYASQFYQEKIKTYLDHLNLLYVAFTRPEQQLYIYAPLPKEKQCKTTAELMCQVLQPPNESDLSWKWDQQEEALIGSLGNYFSAQQSVNKEPQAYLLEKSSHSDWWERLGAMTSAEDSSISSLQSEKIAYGNLIHSFLAEIETIDEVVATLEAYRLKGLISCDEEEKVSKQLNQLWEHEQMRSWFDGSWEVKREMSILLPGEGIERPDRIMMKGNEVIILDFKTGERGSEHRQQVLRYASAFKKMGYVHVRSFLCYLHPYALVEVSD